MIQKTFNFCKRILLSNSTAFWWLIFRDVSLYL